MLVLCHGQQRSRSLPVRVPERMKIASGRSQNALSAAMRTVISYLFVFSHVVPLTLIFNIAGWSEKGLARIDLQADRKVRGDTEDLPRSRAFESVLVRLDRQTPSKQRGQASVAMEIDLFGK